jgi:hypothetical protein
LRVLNTGIDDNSGLAAFDQPRRLEFEFPGAFAAGLPVVSLANF